MTETTTPKLRNRRQPVRLERRLQASKAWARSLGPGPHSRRVLYKYARANKVSVLCALRDFERLGLKLDAASRQELLLATTTAKRRHAPPSNPGVPDGYGEWWDDDFAFIAGHTSGGAPFGVGWGDVDSAGDLKSVDEPDAEPWQQFEDDPPSERAQFGDEIPPAALTDDEIPF